MSGGLMTENRSALGGLVLALALWSGLAGVACSPPPDEPPPSASPCETDRDCAGGLRCDPSQGCVACLFDSDCDADQACVQHTCAAHCDSDQDCEAAGLLCGPVGFCVQCLDNSDCPKAYHCAAGGACELDNCELGEPGCSAAVCEPLAIFCKNDGLYACSDDGDTFVLVYPCPSGTYCDALTTACQDQVCTPNAGRCDGNELAHCKSDGSGFSDVLVDCTDTGQLCWDGECLQPACDPSTPLYCAGEDQYSCSNNGTLSTFYATCNEAEYCSAETGQCLNDGCVANAPVCSDDLLTTCAANGAGPLPGGEACPADSACYDGACLPLLCTDEYVCADNALYHCENNGTFLRSGPICDVSQYCSEEALGCLQDVCAAGAPSCNGSIATTCNEDGSGYIGASTDCAASGLVCSSGACVPGICSPGEFFCVDGNVVRCSADGASYTLRYVCFPPGEYCSPGNKDCLLDRCHAGELSCVDDRLGICAEDGSDVLPAGSTDCAANGQVCEENACVDVICEPNQYVCNGQNIDLCSPKGTYSTYVKTCKAGTFCDSSLTPVACVPTTCLAGAPACNGERLATCNADGTGYASTGTNCADTGMVCDLSSGCASSAIDAVGSATYTTTGANEVWGGYYHVLTARRLTQIEHYASVASTAVFTWLVYGSTTQDGVYTKELQVAVGTSGMNQYHSSGPLDFQLLAGKYYYIGVYMGGTAVHAADDTSSSVLSFGTLLGQSRIYDVNAPIPLTIDGFEIDYDLGYRHRLTTTKP